jgi:hypothetical protein
MPYISRNNGGIECLTIDIKSTTLNPGEIGIEKERKKHEFQEAMHEIIPQNNCNIDIVYSPFMKMMKAYILISKEKIEEYGSAAQLQLAIMDNINRKNHYN